jgi:two-component system, cell cycle sensor histidine kinase and response regulator CckA
MGREGLTHDAEQELLRLRQRVRVVSDAARCFAEATTNYEQLLDIVARCLADTIQDSCMVFLLDQAGEGLDVVALHTSDARVLELYRQSFTGRQLLLAEHPALGHVLRSGQAVLVPRLNERPEKTAEQRHWQQLIGLHSVLLVPLQVQGRSIGVVSLARFQPTSPAFEQLDLELARNLADHAGLAIENGRLYQLAEEARRAAEEAREAMRRSQVAQLQIEQRLQRTLNEMREGYTILSRDLRYVYVNDAGAAHTHLSREQLLGHTPMDLYPGFTGSKIHQALVAAVERGERQRVEEEFVHSDGELGYFELNIQPVPEGLVVLSIDQTERRRAERRRDSLEEQLRQSQKMEAIGRLAGGIAHDFNNVLSVILGYSDQILSDTAPSEPWRDDLVEVQSAAKRAADLTRQLLTFSRQQLIEPAVLDLNEVLLGVERMLGRVLGEQLALEILPAAQLGRVRADRGSVEQLLMNLAVNARDAMPKGGKLTIETANATVDDAFARQHVGSKPGEYVFLGVTDTGIGMDPATRARIFEPFFTTKALGKGTGLGLSTVHGIVQQSGGAVYVYSEPGHGTTFKIYLPRVDAELEAYQPPRPSGLLHGSETVLLVEDERAVRGVARRILERQGYKVLAVDTPAGAMATSNDYVGDIQLLVTDVVMPGWSGIELAGQLKHRRPGLKVLFMSGYTDGAVVSHGVLEQGAAFLQKPFTSELLASKVRAVLDASAA